MLIDEILTEFKELIEIKKNSKNPKELNKNEEEIFQNIVEKAFKIYKTSKESFHELIGQMLNEDSYYGLRVSMYVGSKLDDNAEALLEKTIMERYFLMNGEKFLTGFMAFVYLKGKELLGYVRLTSHRLLIRGSFIKGPNIFGIGHGLTSLVTLAIESSIRSAVIKAAEKRAQAYKEPGSKRLDECEFIQLPILNARKRKRTKTYFEYYTTINIQKKNKVKSINMHITIRPAKLKGEKSAEFKIRREKILQSLKETILNTRLLELLKK